MLKVSRREMLTALGVTGMAGLIHARNHFKSKALFQPTPRETLRGLVRREPVLIEHSPAPELVSDDQLLDVLRMARPYSNTQLDTIPFTIHALRLWGPKAEFPRTLEEPTYEEHFGLSSAEMIAILLDTRTFVERTGRELSAVLVPSPFGIRVLSNTDTVYGWREASAHIDEIPCELGEIGLPSTTPLIAKGGIAGTVADLITDAMTRISQDVEIEWTAGALSLYVATRARWKNRQGQEWSLNEVALHLLRKSIGHGACMGLHSAYSLVLMLRTHEKVPFLTDTTVRDVRNHLLDITRHLVTTQHDDGSWSADWYDDAHAPKPPYLDSRINAIAATGHQLEWLAVAPPTLRPNREVLARAITFLARTIPAMEDVILGDFHNYPPVSHAARALSLFKGVEPYAFYSTRAVRSERPTPTGNSLPHHSHDRLHGCLIAARGLSGHRPDALI